MTPPPFNADSLKIVLEQLHTFDALDAHAWASAAFVQDAVRQMPDLQNARPGKQLAFAVESVFAHTMPGVAPRHGKRLDTSWGEFGILAAQYFAPLKFGASAPGSLREAWGRIDRSILLYVFGRAEDSLTPGQIQSYKLVGDEPDVTPASTLSDWHRKGIQRLAGAIQARESFLMDRSRSAVRNHKDEATPAVNAARKKDGPHNVGRRSGLKPIQVVLIILLVSLLAAGAVVGLKAKRMYDHALLLRRDVSQLRVLVADPGLQTFQAAGPSLTRTRQDYLTLKTEANSFLWLAPWLNWVPEYGGDLASVQDLVTLSDSLLASADLTYQAILPLTNTMNGPDFDPALMTKLLQQAGPQLSEAKANLDQAVTAREHLNVDRLSPRLRDLITSDVDRMIPLMQDGLVFMMEAPRLAGATHEGPKTYLLLAQNSDELRPTGGFITAAATLLLQDGRISNLTFHDSGLLDNWQRPYPAAPWQLQQYMNSDVLILRDANWFVDFPTAALYAEYLYSFSSDHSVDGVIAFDQQALVDILRVVGPIRVEGAPEPIDADNVIAFMRASKTPSAEDLATPGWSNKIFINNITRALLTRIFAGNVDWTRFSKTLLQVLDEHHLLLQFDDPVVTPLLSKHAWDGALRPGTGDFLMVVDSNVGFNKTNAVVDTRISYEIDLSNPSSPMANLAITHTNHAQADVPCLPYGFLTEQDIKPDEWEGDYPIDRCFWDYLRFYTVPGAEILHANLQSIPAENMVSQHPVAPQVDVLEDDIPGIQGFGGLKLVPGGQTVETDFRFSLPDTILKSLQGTTSWIYRLRVQKQPGTLAVPIIVKVILPEGAVIQSKPAGMIAQGNALLLETTLRLDFDLEIQFNVP